jgi:hypothetical protein
MTVKLCMECLHFSPSALTNEKDSFDRCMRAAASSLVDGKMRAPQMYCEIERKNSALTSCGPDARFFEEAEREPAEVDGEALRGREAAAFLAEEQARIQRELK